MIQDEKILDLINPILKAVLTIQDREFCYEVIHHLAEDIKMCLEENPDATEIYAFNEEEGIDPYMQVLSTCIVYGMQDTCEDAIEFYEIILDNT